MKITLQLFGAFRDYKTPNILEFDIEDNISVAQLKKMIADEFGGQEPYTALLSRSRIADANHIFTDESKIAESGDYAILPPVNGG